MLQQLQLTFHFLLLDDVFHLPPAQVVLLLLRGRLEGHGGRLSPEVLEPRGEVVARDEVRLVQNQHQLLA